MDGEEMLRVLDRIAEALEKIAKNTTPESDEEIRAKIQGFRSGGQ